MAVDIATWAERKRASARAVAPAAIRDLTPSLKDFLHAVTTGRQAIAVIAEYAHASAEEGALAPAPAAEAGACFEAAEVSVAAVGTDDLLLGGRVGLLGELAKAFTGPLLAHDLVVRREQLYGLRLAGADAAWLHPGAAPAHELKAMLELSASMHMACAVEIPDRPALELAQTLGARCLVIPAFGERGVDLTLLDALAPWVNRTVALVVRGPFEAPADLEPLRGRVDAAWVAGAFSRGRGALEALRPFVESAENG